MFIKYLIKISRFVL